MLSAPNILKVLLQTLIQLAEEELGGGKGAEKKAWVLDKLRAALVASKWSGWLIELTVNFASIALEFLIKEALATLGK